MPRPIRVAFVDHSAQLGGGELALVRLLANLDRRRVLPVVVLGEDGPLASLLETAGVEVVVCRFDTRLGARRKEELGVSALRDWRLVLLVADTVRRLRRVLRDCEAEIVQTNSLKAHLVGGVAGRLAGARVVWHVRDHLATPYLPRTAVAATRLAARLVPHRVLAVSVSVARTVGRPDVIVVHEGVDVPPAAGETPGSAARRVGIVGRISPWKGQDVFIAAAARVAASFPEVEFVIAGAPLFGEQEFERQLHRRVEALGLSGSVRFLGHCDDVWSVYRSLDVAVHASTLPEPYGGVILEAMASGTAVVAAGSGGVLEIVQHDVTGLLVEPGDPEALADAIEHLLADETARRRLAAAARRWVEETHSPRRDAATVEALYEGLVR